MLRESVGEISTSEKEAISPPTEVSVVGVTGSLKGFKFTVPVFNPAQPWTGHVTVYLPQTGAAWTGTIYEGNWATVDGSIIAFYHQNPGSIDKLLVSVSTNSYQPHIRNQLDVVKAEAERYKTGIGQAAGGGPAYSMRLENIFGPETMRNKRGPKVDGWPDTNAFSLVTRASRLRSVDVEGTNAVVAIEFGTNVLAKIAFDKNVRPVWATTNGVSIGPIPTNTVFVWDVVTNYPVLKVVY